MSAGAQSSVSKELTDGGNSMSNNPGTTRTSVESEQLDHRLHDLGWGLLFLLTGVVWLLPSGRVPDGTWLFGAAAILLGVNLIRYLMKVPVSGFSVVLGFGALLAGLSEFWRTDLPLLAICLIVIGASLALKPLLPGRH
jgi:hypothetical protein